MKRILSAILVLVMCAAMFTACKMKDDSDSKSSGEDVAISIDLSKLQLSDDGQSYYCDVEVGAFCGTLDGADSAEKISFEIADSQGNLIFKSETEAQEDWTIENSGLVYGENYITISVLDEDDEVLSEESLYVMNVEMSNAESLAMDKLDTDGDGLTDLYELYCTLTSVSEKDSDGNGVEDGQEDFDGDGLNNLEEQILGSLAHRADSDGDKLTDKEESEFGSSPVSMDTDGDGVDDYLEYINGLDAVDSDNSESRISVKDSTTTANGLEVGVELDVKAGYAETFNVSELSQKALVSEVLKDMVVGDVISITVEDGFESANISVSVPDDSENGFALYYFDEEELMLQRVSGQKYSDGVITANLEHFSQYVVLEEPQDDYVSLVMRFKERIPETDTDFDNDGFGNNEDVSKYSAKSFKTYEDYLKYHYPDKDVVTVYVDYTTDYGDDEYLKSFKSGHTWIGYTTSDGETRKAGYYPDGSAVWTVTNAEFDGVVKTDKEYYLSSDPTTKYKYTEDSDIQPEADSARMMIPFVVDPDCREKFDNFVNNYDKTYKLYDNNCTTFALECLDELGVDHQLNEFYSSEGRGPVNKFFYEQMTDSNSPGHTAYVATVCYPLDIVYTAEDEGETGFTSRVAWSNACLENTERVEKEINYLSSDKIEYNGHTYQIIDVSMTWTSAKAYCESMGGHLATITSAKEQAAIEALLATGSKKQYWLGMDTETGWVTGEPVEYTNWDAIEPNGCKRRGAKERYVHILNVPNPAVSGSERLEWNDMFNDNTFPGEESNFSLYTVGILCEWD